MEKIYEKYSKQVYYYLYSITHDREISEELMQETFYSAIKGINKFKNECSMHVWLCQIAKNKWLNFLKKSKRITSLSFEDGAEKYLPNDNSIEDIDEKMDIIRFYKEIHKLDDRTKEVVYLRIKGELSFKEIGEIMDKSEQWARTTFYRGKSKIKEDILRNEKRM